MGSYTTNYRLLKVDDGSIDPAKDDYVDVSSQLDRNLSMIDTIGRRICNYEFFEGLPDYQFPIIGHRPGDKIFSTYQMGAKVFTSEGFWVNSKSVSPTLTYPNWNSGYQGTDAGDDPAYYVHNNMVYLSGEIAKTGNAAWTRGISNSVFPSGQLPSPSTTREIILVGGKTQTRHPSFWVLAISTSGAGSISLYSPAEQTASSAENYVSFAGASYALL
jgi:hypothetical protein